MADEKLCKLCQADSPHEVDLEKALYKSANNLLQRLFDCYNIDVSVLGGSPSTCKPCFEGVLQISQQLQKWSNAQKVLQTTACLPDTDHYAVISIKKESKVLWDENDDAEFPPEDSLEMEETSNSNDLKFPDDEDLKFLDEEEPQTENVEYIDEEEPQKENIESFAEGPSANRSEEVSAKVYEELFGIEQIQEKSTEPVNWRLTPHEFFCVCLRQDGLALGALFKDKTPQRNIRILCTCCNKVFANVSVIQNHSLVSRAHPEYWCRLCGIHFPSITELEVHEKYKNHQLANLVNLVIRCLKCDKISTQYLNAIKHQNTCHDKVSFDCKRCSMSFASCISLAKHEWKHKNHVCCYPHCQQRFEHWELYLKHLNLHKRIASRCPVPGCTSILKPGEHVKHLRTHSKNPVKFYYCSRT